MMQEQNRIHCLDGLRGIAALWVLLGHACLLTGMKIPVLDEPDLGVDLFVILSGFLMAYHYQLRSIKEPWEQPRTWSLFWIRRFFRIAPLYYLLLVIAIIAGPAIYESRVIIDDFLGSSHQQATRYTDQSIRNILFHATFLFGAIPKYAFRTALPDWSIGLEMQFYAAFPFLMLFIRKFRWAVATVVICVVSVLIAAALPKAGINFPMPSFLPLKLNFFLAGMLCAAALQQRGSTTAIYAGLALLFAAIPVIDADPFKMTIRLAVVGGFFLLVHHRHLGVLDAPTSWLSRKLGSIGFHWLGELSFGAYLWHLLLMQPIAAWLVVSAADIGTTTRFLLVCVAVLPLTYALAFITFKAVEGPGQLIGRKLIGLRPRSDPATIA